MKKILLITLVLASALTASAIPAMKGLRPVTQPDGTVIYVERVGDEHMNFTLDSEGALLISVNGMYRYADLGEDGTLIESETPVMWSSERVQERITMLNEATTSSKLRAASVGLIPDRNFPTTGQQKALVILVEYSDVSFTLEDPYSYFHDMLNKEGFSDSQYGGTGSCRDYFIESSMGKFMPEFDVYGPVKLSGRRKDYGSSVGGYEANAYKMVTESCEILDDTVDFSQYDRNDDGVIDNVFVFYAGQGEATYGPEESVWPHSSQVIGEHIHDGKRLDVYGCTNEWGLNRPDGIGTFCHEFSHVLGLPDLYNTVGNTTYTPGYWDLMDYGSYLNGGMTPPVYSSFERNALGWIELTELTPGMTGVTLPDLRTSNVAYSLTDPSNPNEFYLFENRRQDGTDTYLPGEGMLVWHVDYKPVRFRNNVVNNENDHQCVDIVEADKKPSKASRNGSDAFPGTTSTSRLDMQWWSGNFTEVSLRNIAEAEDGTVTFNVIEPLTEIDEDFYTVDNVIVHADDDDVADAIVRGYIVGYVKNGNLSVRTAAFEPGTSKTNIMLADSPDETDWCNCIPVQLVVGTDARNDMNLAENPEMLGSLVEITGTLTSYLGARGIKSITSYTILSSPENAIIDEIAADDDEQPQWYTIQGIRVSSPDSPGIYIRRTSRSTLKVTL